MPATVREGEEVLLRRVNVWVQGIVKGVDTRYSPPIAYVAWGSRGWRNTKECWIAAVPINSDLLKKVPVEDKQTKKRRMKNRKQKTRIVRERDDYSHDEDYNDSEEEHNTSSPLSSSSSSSSFYSSSYYSRRPLASGLNKSQQPVLIRFQGRVFTSEEEFMKFNEKWKQEIEARRQHEQETFKQQRREFFEYYNVERAEMQAEATAERNVWRPRRFRQEDSWSIETEEDYEEENVDCSAWAMEEDYERVPMRGAKEKVVKASGAASSSAQKDKMKEEATTEHNYSQEREDYGEEDGEEEPLHLFSPLNEAEEQEEYQSSSFSSASSSFLFMGNDESNVWSFDHKSTNNHPNFSHLDSFTSVSSSSSINFDIDGTTNNDISSRFGVPGLSSGRHQEITDFGLPSSSAPLSFSSSFVPSNASYDLPQLSSSTSSHSYSLPVSNDFSSSSSVSLLLENAERNMHSFSLPTSSPSSSSFSFDIEIDEEEENKQKQLKRSYGPPLHASSSLLRTSFDASSVSATSLSASDDGGYTLPLPLDADLSQTSKNYSLPLSPHVRSITDVDCFTVPSSHASSSSHSINMTKSTRNDEKAASDDLLVQEDEASFLGAFMRMQDRKYHHVFKQQQQQSNNADPASSCNNNNNVNHTKKTNNKKKESSSQLKATTTTRPNKKTTNNNNNSTSATEGLSKQEKRRLKWEQRQWKRELFKQKQKQAQNWGTGAP